MNTNLEFPRVLVISNNSFSTTNNNGKTLFSFFEDYPKSHLKQLYFSQEIPDVSSLENYYRITDAEVIKSVIMNKECGKIIIPGSTSDAVHRKSRKKSVKGYLSKFNISRLGREFFWKQGSWKNEKLESWLKDFSPEVIFFCAGDSGFAYEIVEYIKKKYSCKLIVYITDDYILPRKKISIFWWIRRNIIFKKMKEAVYAADLFLTISEQMKQLYKDILKKDSIIAVNYSDSLKDPTFEVENINSYRLLYAGGLHFNRYKTLLGVGKSIDKINSSDKFNKPIYLDIYTNKLPDMKILKLFAKCKSINYKGSLSATELKKELNSCDFPLHVESFDTKSIESTRLSLSTKIPEYLSLEKPLIAVGPDNIASIQYLYDCACVISDEKQIEKRLLEFLKDNKLQENIALKSRLKYEKLHNKNNLSSEFLKKIVSLKYL